MLTLPLSIQLYTLRDQTAKDFAGTLMELGKLGYKGVELAGYGNLKTAAEVRKAADDAGVVISGAHVGPDALLNETSKVLEDQAVLGNHFVICPWAPLDGKDETTYRDFAAKLEQCGQVVTRSGRTFAYHNHSFEHKPFRKGLDGLDVIFGMTSPSTVKSELDVFWTQHGGHDPVKYIEKLGSRVALLHLKDMQVGPDRKFANVGEGILDFRAIVAAGRKVGVAWYVVEQDDCYGQDPMEMAKISIRNLEAMGIV